MEQPYLPQTPLKIVVVGEVDDGKSTLIGRLLYETGSLTEGKLEEIKTISLKRNMPLEWSFVLDAFQAERDQAITIDTTQVRLKTGDREVILIDAPGHIEFLKNMISGAAEADAALLLVDGFEGIQEQTRRHAYLLNFLGIKQVAVLVNKLDLIEFSRKKFAHICSGIDLYLQDVGIKAKAFIPISARNGDMLVNPSNNMSWYKGQTVLSFIQSLLPDNLRSDCLRLPVQDVYKFDERRIITGRIESGALKIGDELLFSPSNQTARVRSIEGWRSELKLEARAGESVGITLDKPLFVQRGDMISHLEKPPLLTDIFCATLFWLADSPLELKKNYQLKLCTRELPVRVEAIDHELDITTLQKSKTASLRKNQCGEVTFRTSNLVPVDEYQEIRRTGRFVLVDDQDIVAAGMIAMKGYPNLRKSRTQGLNITQVRHSVSREKREKRNGHRGGVLWLTGLSGAGKSTLAMAVEQCLFSRGYQVYTLDGDNIRFGLNANLSFSPEDRAENTRRMGEVAALFAEMGCICIVALISPYQSQREQVRNLFSAGKFHEVYVKASMETCEKRDPKGLYQRARRGEIPEFTGVSAPYEAPENPELIVDTETLTIENCIHEIVDYVALCFSNEKVFICQEVMDV